MQQREPTLPNTIHGGASSCLAPHNSATVSKQRQPPPPKAPNCIQGRPADTATCARRRNGARHKRFSTCIYCCYEHAIGMAGRFTVAGCGSIARCHGFLSVHPACLRAIADRQVVAMQLGQRRHARIDVTRDRPGRIDRHSGGTATVSIDGRSTFSLSCRPNLPVARVACTNQGEKGHLLLALGGAHANEI